MKFPMQPRPFLPIQLTPEQCIEYEQTAMAVLIETITEYEHYVYVKNRTMNKKRWKAVKTRENVTVYKKRDLEDVALLSSGAHPSAQAQATRAKAGSVASSSSPSSSNGSMSVSATMDWQLPKLLAIGTIVGSLEDVMYGVISSDSDCVKVKTTYVDDELVDGQILSQLKFATHEDPFLFLGLKWFVKAHPASINAVVWPRDMVFIEGTGVRETAKGNKIGYHLMHSVELPECHPLTSMGIVRGQLSTCLLFKQLQNGTVEVYMKSFLEAAGSLPDTLAIMSAANGLIGCWKSVWCAQNKKLAWFLQDAAKTRRQTRARHDPVTFKTNAHGKQCCSLCESSLSGFRSPVVCDLCRVVVCSKCKTARKITFVHNHDEVKKIPTVFCKKCITRANSTSSAEVARREYVYGEQANRCDPAPSTASNAQTALLGRSSSDLAWEAESVSEIDTINDWENRNHTPADLLRASMAYTPFTPRRFHPDAPVTAITPRRPHAITASSPPPPPPQHQDPGPQHATEAQRQLCMQMNQLRLQAEQAYQTTRSNNRAMYETTKGRPF